MGCPCLRISGGTARSGTGVVFDGARLCDQQLLERLEMGAGDVDLYEVNEAFSAVSLACNQLSALPAGKVNVNGGAVSLGHPIGASGARILVTLLFAMQSRDASGIASLCIGGGEAVAVAVEDKE